MALGGRYCPGLGVFADPEFRLFVQEFSFGRIILANISGGRVARSIVPFHIRILVYLDAVLSFIKVIRFTQLPIRIRSTRTIMPRPLSLFRNVIAPDPEHVLLPVN